MAGVNRLKQSFPFKSRRSSFPYNTGLARNTWTQQFFCLASTGHEYTKNKDYLAQLNAEGLGGKKIQFEEKYGSHEYLIRNFAQNIYPWHHKVVLLRRGGVALEEATSALWKNCSQVLMAIQFHTCVGRSIQEASISHPCIQT